MAETKILVADDEENITDVCARYLQREGYEVICAKDGEEALRLWAKTVAADSKTFLRLEDLDATNGPDLYVYLIKEGTKTSEGLNLGALKGNKGSHNYELPDNVDLTQYNQVVIYCKQFSVNFGTADLKVV